MDFGGRNLVSAFFALRLLFCNGKMLKTTVRLTPYCTITFF